jgi:hypothetical protein
MDHDWEWESWVCKDQARKKKQLEGGAIKCLENITFEVVKGSSLGI